MRGVLPIPALGQTSTRTDVMGTEKNMFGIWILFLLNTSLFFSVRCSVSPEILCNQFKKCYSVHNENNENCDPECGGSGTLATMKTDAETQTVLSLLSKLSNSSEGDFFRLGLVLNKGVCVMQEKPLKGFVWVTGEKGAPSVNIWEYEVPNTCSFKLCGGITVFWQNESIKWKWKYVQCKIKCSYICQYTFNGTCQPLNTEGVGEVIYQTPNGIRTGFLDFYPSGTNATVTCPGSGKSHTLYCQPSGTEYKWVGSEYADFPCKCDPGYERHGIGECTDVDDCLGQPCEFQCVNTMGSFHCLCNKTAGYTLEKDGRSCILLGLTQSATPTALENSSSISATTKQPRLLTDSLSKLFIPLTAALGVLIILIVLVVCVFKLYFRKSVTPSAKDDELQQVKDNTWKTETAETGPA